ncbi:vacuolar protein sorting-associated protein 9A-like isoform X1 [Zingiber officinale]|uniref:vacuolar protein sorting-associated protein 9A-like isoform X1 n=1 Tax=Zingiber officinale TaxID=94328 RepID=UPI001C4AC84F|nr:vacuolar protein sorting-associated protein 9A-like isoform X1 [Zingiber officinale]
MDMAIAIEADSSVDLSWNCLLLLHRISMIFSIGFAIPLLPISFAPSKDEGQRVQAFLARMETTIKEHPLWAHAAHQEIDNAMEGLEKFIMTKLFDGTFASSSEDVKLDQEISEKICLLQHFVTPDQLDVPRVLQNEASWLFAAKELQKINSFKAPRDKLHCIMNCCRIINNLLLEISMTTNHKPAGADDFLPILIFTTIKANPPHLHSNLKFIQLFRKHSKLVSEVEYYLTNLISAKTFIANINASSLSMDESEFHKNMQLARSTNEMTINEPSAMVHSSEANSSTPRSHGKEIIAKDYRYPFMEAKAQDLRFEDVQKLLGLYKHIVTKYAALSDALSRLSIDQNHLLLALQNPKSKAKMKEQIDKAINNRTSRMHPFDEETD